MRKAGDIITALFEERFGSKFMETVRSNAGLFSSWKAIVTEVWPCTDRSMAEDIPAAAVHSQILELERGILLVEADHPGWVQILQTKQAELLLAVQQRYPELGIRGIAFRLSRKPFSSPKIFKEPSEALTSAKEGSYEYKVQAELWQPLPTYSSGQDAPRDEDFYTALKGLEESIKKRNGL